MNAVRPLAIGMALLLGACTGSPAVDALSETASKLDEIRSGHLTMRLLAVSRGLSQTTVGFELDGQFALPRPNALPVADMTYTRIQGDDRTEARFISTGSEAFVELDGTMYQLGDEQTATLVAPASGDAGTPLTELGIDGWVVNPRLSVAASEAGESVERISGRLDVANAINDLLDLARQLGAEDLAAVPRIEGRAETQLDRAVRSSTFELLTGESDRYLRRLAMQIDFAATAPPSLRPALQTLADINVRFELALSNHNQQVTVDAPEGAIPYSEGSR
ncbi:MAG TPA: hypothetical protein VHI54_02990 [Actinomycetota bacterium]|nr:hypothetical protein [Actinomycetota bacterium]